MNFFKNIFSTVGGWISNLFIKAASAYDKLEDTAKPIVKVAVNVVQAIKTFNDSQTANTLAAIIKVSIQGTVDDIIIDNTRKWITEEFPKIAIALKLVDSTINLKSTDEKLKAIINALQLSNDKGAKALAFAAELAVYLEDGKLSLAELTDAANDYYNDFVKK